MSEIVHLALAYKRATLEYAEHVANCAICQSEGVRCETVARLWRACTEASLALFLALDEYEGKAT